MKQVSRIFWLFTLTWLIAACGGGGSLEREDDGGAGTPSTPPTAVIALAIDIVDASGEPATELAEGAPLTVRVTATSDGSALSGALINFSLSDTGLASFGNDTASALTDSNGVAQINLLVGELSGSGTVTASYSDEANTSIGFSSTGSSAETSISLSLSASSTVVSDGEPMVLEATVTDNNGNPVDNVVVLFEISEPTLASFENDTGTALTNAQGVAQISVFVGESSGSGTITASIDEVTDTVGFESTGASQQGAFSLELFASTTQLASSGNDSIELIAVLKSEENILLSGIPVTFSANQNASLTIVSANSGEDGTARALLTTRNNPENRIIQVSATSGTLSQTLDVSVVGTEVNINGASSVILGDSAPITVVLSDSDGDGIAGQTVAISANIGSLDNESPVTNANGQVTVNYTADESGVASINASALNASTNFTINVQQDDFSFQALPTEGVLLNTDETLTLRWFKNGQAFVNGDVTVTSSRGTISGGASATPNVVKTDASGIATVTINSSFAGPASISAIGKDGDNNEVTARGTIEFVADEVDNIFVDATPDIIGPEGQTATITAVLRDPEGNLVKGKTVNFSILSDATSGSISPNTAITDSNGIASTVYTSNSVSEINGVTIEAESDGVTAFTNLTVGDRAFDISIGTGNEIVSPDQSSYVKEFSVFVTDAAGRPISDAALTANVTPPAQNAYIKGQWVWNDDVRIYQQRGLRIPGSDPVDYDPVTFCNNEDANGNGRLDLLPAPGEDINGDGQLTPGNIAVVSFKDGVARTDENGQATIEVRYAKQFGGWVFVTLGVNGQTAGTESSETQLYGLGAASDDLTEETNPPPANPFGVLPDCTTIN
jgi:hypothetical protein